MLGMRQTTGAKSRGGLQDLMIIWGKEAKSPGAARNAPSRKVSTGRSEGTYVC